MTSDRRACNGSSAVVFHLADMRLADMPSKQTGQTFVLFSFESPVNTQFVDLRSLPCCTLASLLQIIGCLGLWPEQYTRVLYYVCTFWYRLQMLTTEFEQRGYFNWTMSYRTDSDIWFPYGFLVRKKNPEALTELEQSLQGRNGTVWLASNCQTNSRREKRCTKGRWRQCETALLRRYKFYLAFENSVCRDYASEKFFARLAEGLVPIVLRRSDLDAYSLPDKSFIAVDDFDGTQALAELLNHLNTNLTAFAEYHTWRCNFTVVLPPSTQHHFCRLCSMLTDGRRSSGDKRAVLDDAHHWWNIDGGCAAPGYAETLLA